MCVCVHGAIQLSDGFKSGLADAMNNYATKPNKKEAVDGIQTTVCLSLSLSLSLCLSLYLCVCVYVCISLCVSLCAAVYASGVTKG